MKQNEYLNYILDDVLGHIPHISSRAMFGGYGIYQGNIIFAIIVNDQLYFKVNDHNRLNYIQAESTPFVYQRGSHKKVSLPYWSVPEDIFHNPDLIREWVDQSVQATLDAH